MGDGLWTKVADMAEVRGLHCGLAALSGSPVESPEWDGPSLGGNQEDGEAEDAERDEASGPTVGLPSASEYLMEFEAKVLPELIASGVESLTNKDLRSRLAASFGLSAGQLATLNRRGLRHNNLTAHCLKLSLGKTLRPGLAKGEYRLLSAPSPVRPLPNPSPSPPDAQENQVRTDCGPGFSAEAAAACILDVLDIPEEGALHAVSAAMGGRPLLLSGPPSGGKTTLARLLPKAMEAGGSGPVAFREDSMDMNSTRYGLIGGVDANGVWRDGFLAASARACRPGGRMVCLFDEFSRFPQGSNLGSALTMLSDPAGARRLVLTGHPDGEVLDVPPGFVFVATRNPSDGESAYRMEPSVRSRFEEIDMVPPPPEKGLLGDAEWRRLRAGALDSLFGGLASADVKARAAAALDESSDSIRKIAGALRAAAPGWTGHRRLAAVCSRLAARASAKSSPPAGALAMEALLSEIVRSADVADFESDAGLLGRIEALPAKVPEGRSLFEALAARGR